MRTNLSGAGAYTAVKQRQQTPRESEADIIMRITGRLKAALESGDLIDRARSLSDTRTLWTVFLTDLGSEENQLPKPLRAQLYSIGLAVLRECNEEPATADIPFIVDIHQSLIDGLMGRMEPSTAA